MTNKEYKNLWKTIVLSSRLFLAACLIFASCKSSCIKREMATQPSATSDAKFKDISRWIPASTNAILTVDLYKLLNSKLWNTIINLESDNKWLKYLKAPGLDFKSDLGMVTAFLESSSKETLGGLVFLIQGGFHQDIITSRIKARARQDNLSLTTEKYKGFAIYSEFFDEGTPSPPHAFTAIDNGIIALASKDNLKWLIDNKPTNPISFFTNEVDWQKPILGKLIANEPIIRFIQPPWDSIDNVQLQADIADDINAQITIILKEGGNIQKLKTALEGLKALEELQRLDDEEMLSAIEKISINNVDGKIVIEIPSDIKLVQLLLTKYITKDEQKEVREDEDI